MILLLAHQSSSTSDASINILNDILYAIDFSRGNKNWNYHIETRFQPKKKNFIVRFKLTLYRFGSSLFGASLHVSCVKDCQISYGASLYT